MSGSRHISANISRTGAFEVFGAYAELVKLHLCLYVAVSGVFGFAVAAGQLSPQAIETGAVILILACGAAVMNNIQDREFDTFFERTRSRSLPLKKIPVSHAAVLSISLILAGFLGLLLLSGIIPFLWGLSAFVTYNLIYTPLKKQSLFAILPGSLCGMSVPAIGWTASGRAMDDPVIWSIMIVSGLWQMAHYLIIQLKNETSGRCIDAEKRYPSFYHHFSLWQIRVQAMLWTSLYLLSMMMFLFYSASLVEHFFFILFFNIFFCWSMVFFTLIRKKASMMPAFVSINISLLVFMGANIASYLF